MDFTNNQIFEAAFDACSVNILRFVQWPMSASDKTSSKIKINCSRKLQMPSSHLAITRTSGAVKSGNFVDIGMQDMCRTLRTSFRLHLLLNADGRVRDMFKNGKNGFGYYSCSFKCNNSGLYIKSFFCNYSFGKQRSLVLRPLSIFETLRYIYFPSSYEQLCLEVPTTQKLLMQTALPHGWYASRQEVS